MDIQDVVDVFQDEHSVVLQCSEDQREEYVEWNTGFNPLSDTISYDSRTDTITEFKAVGFRIELGQGCAISGSLPGLTVAEYNETTEETEWDDAAVMAAVNAKCGVFNRELIG